MLNFESLYSTAETVLAASYEVIQRHMDLAYMGWLAWVFWPLVVTFLLPVSLIFCLYASSIFLHLYRLRHTLRDVVAHKDYWDAARHFLSAVWDAQGKFWHGYEVVNFEKIPDTGPALLVYYHGALPIDMYYLIAKCILHKKRHIRPIGDRFLFRIPGFKLLTEVFGVIPGTRTSCAKLLQEGHLLSIAPGGLREAQFGDEYYQLMWHTRQGFAKVALETQVPIIPVFTQNVREAFRSVSIGKSFFRYIYEKYRLPVVPVYGMFPVKLRTYIGDPILYDPKLTSEELTKKVQEAIEELIKKRQKVPGKIFRALSERIFTPKEYKAD